ncbi:conserved protein of unknown function [Candidatus Hydrogenisulfobacillus filiaventi]|uniref:Uncharacterized protein n=1 Tax=Candidatus Hydrogenisulfobacillus filiaventi TaxID=2707344 RepID=A0A6F8ZH07_9FIRM|nr:hypothetical protein [Bacillota bacterium]CAB1128957.1 conserved protein of unknown function [Candidatus Hydrogenisulfobacillus filiaventi]
MRRMGSVLTGAAVLGAVVAGVWAARRSPAVRNLGRWGLTAGPEVWRWLRAGGRWLAHAGRG